MAICPRCAASFSYTETHVCEGRDRVKIWWIAAVALGAFVGAPLGLFYGKALVREACGQPDASNLCGFMSAPSVPFYIVIGAIIGASVAAFTVAVLLRKRNA
jgi:hypothetical protein